MRYNRSTCWVGFS